MKQSTFIAKITNDKKIEIPPEVSLKKIKPRRFEILISENPLYKLLKITKSEN